MHHPQTARSREGLYRNSIAITVLDPAARAAHAQRPLAFRAVNDTVMPKDRARRDAFLADLSAFLRTGDAGAFCVVEENLGELYLVAIGGLHRISRKVYATHPLLPGRLLVIGGIGMVRPADDGRGLTLETPRPELTLHRLFADLPVTSMSAACPTPRKTIKSIPNEDPVGGYSLHVAGSKYRHVEMIATQQGGIDPQQFPVIDNVAWGTIGDDLAFYVYAVPDNAIPVCNLLQADSEAEITAALDGYLQAGQQLMRALRHLHEAGYVFNQPHQGNVYQYVDEQGEARIVIADLDTLQSVRDFSRKVPQGAYLSPMAFATLVNLQVAATHVAQIAWLDFLQDALARLGIERYPGAASVYAAIITDLLAGYIDLHEAKRAEIVASMKRYYYELCRRAPDGPSDTSGVARLRRSDLYEMDVFGCMFTYILMDEAYCSRFGAKLLTEGLAPRARQSARLTLETMAAKGDHRALASVMQGQINQIIQQRSNEAMQELLQGLSQRQRVTKHQNTPGARRHRR